MSYYYDWQTVDILPYKGLDAKLSYTFEDMPVRDLFDYDEEEIRELEKKINRGDLYWIIARVELYLGNVTIGDSVLGGILVESIDELKEVFLPELCDMAYTEAQEWYNTNKDFLNSKEFNDNE